MAACLGVLIVVISLTNFADYDYWWHMKKGETIVNTGKITNPDTFSYTFSGQPDEDGEWLADFIIYQSYNLGGLVGSNLLKALILCLTFLFLFGVFSTLSQKKQFWLVASIFTLVIILFSIRFRLYVRPFLFSYLFFSAFIFFLLRYSVSNKKKYLYFLFLTQILWANSSNGAIFGLVITGLYILSNLISEKKINLKLLIIGALILIGFCISPAGPMRLVAYVENFIAPESRNLIFSVGEHQPLSFQLLFGFGLSYTFGFQIVIIACVVGIAFFKGYKRLFLLFLFITFLIPTTIMIRLISFSCLASAGFVFLFMERIFHMVPILSIKYKLFVNVVVCVLLLGLASFSSKSTTYVFGSQPKPDTFPEKAISFLDENGVEGKMFNSYSIGGFSIWKAPHRKVFIDGRATHVYSPEFFSQYEEMIKNAAAWKNAENEWGFNYTLLDYDIRSGGKHFPFHLNDNEDWALVYWDNHSAVYLKRNSKNQEIIDKNEYKITKPNQYSFSYLDEFKYKPNELAEAYSQIKREINLNPKNQEPLLASAYFLLNFGKEQGQALGVETLKECLDMKPDMAMEHSAYAKMLLLHGRDAEALIELDKALLLDPNDLIAIEIKMQLDPNYQPPKGIKMSPH